MNAVVFWSMILLCGTAAAAPARWKGISLSTGEWYSNGAREYHLGTTVYGANGEHAWMHSFIYGHIGNVGLYLKHLDFSQETMEPTYNWWALASYGDVVSAMTFDSLDTIKDFYSTNLNAPYTDGTLVSTPDDFYMAFKVSEVLVENHDYVPGQTWYGWVHVSIDENLEMTLLGDGIDLDGGAVTVGYGATPEPASGVLLLLGGALLALRRNAGRRRHAR